MLSRHRVLFCCFTFFVSLSTSFSQARVDHPWTIYDSVAVRYVQTVQDAAGWLSPAAGEPVVVAPDGENFFFVTRKGDLSCDCNIYELYVFQSAAIKRMLADSNTRRVVPKPFRHVTLRSNSSEQGAIVGAAWMPDGRTIKFRSASADQPLRVYSFDIISGKLIPLTAEHRGDVHKFAQAGKSIVYTVNEAELDTRLNAYPAVPIREQELAAILISSPLWFGALFASVDDSPPKQIGPRWRYQSSHSFAGPWLSPDGRYAMVMRVPSLNSEIPRHWAGYDGYDIPTETLKQRLIDEEFPRFMMVDISKATIEPLFDAPAGVATRMGASHSRIMPKVLWSPDGKRAILINTALPLDQAHPERAGTAYIVDYDLATRRYTVIEALESGEGSARRRLQKVDWLAPGRLLAVHETIDGVTTSATIYRFATGRWIGKELPTPPHLPTKVAPRISGGLRVELHQSANHPPMVIASNGRHDVALLPPDPALLGKRLARAERVTWKESEGHTHEGLLMLPERHSGPMPLAIQAYFYAPHLFRPDGQAATADAAQALVANGIAVLQFDIPDSSGPSEGRTVVERIDAAVEMLATEKLIDPLRVGLIGFSRGSYNVYYAITHPGQTPIAAAVAADGWTGSYSELLLGQVVFNPGFFKSLEIDWNTQNGGGSFWEDKQGWIENSPEFNVDKVEAPVLFTINGKQGRAFLYYNLAAFRLNKKAAELLLISGVHQLHRPKERIASMQATVDWMRYWLKGEFDPERSKADQYLRWEELRIRQERVVGKAVAVGRKLPPLLPLQAVPPAGVIP